MLGPAVVVRRFGAWASCLLLLRLEKVWGLSDLKLPVPICNQTQSTLLSLPPLCHCMQDKRASPLIHLHSLSSEYLQGDVVCNSSSLSSGLFCLLVHHLFSVAFSPLPVLRWFWPSLYFLLYSTDRLFQKAFSSSVPLWCTLDSPVSSFTALKLRPHGESSCLGEG